MKHLALALAVLLSGTACSGGSDGGGGAGGSAGSDRSASSMSSTTREGASKDGGNQASGSGETPGDAGGSTTTSGASGADEGGAESETPGDVEPNVTLDKECVTRGLSSDLQGITARVPTGAIVIYSTEYSDHSNEVSNPGYATGYGDTTSVAGTARATWVVPADAPTGSAVLHVAGTVEMTPSELRFEVVDSKGDCP
ncbi:MAG: hypothetical protein HYU28_07330 [Actinobacteria bacterium]|nr:hypothetical protein [Actinomycetota bacterium]